ncbi:MAG: SxtJ family membrane protein [Gallionellaceae bacterium]|nr:SxtJ family membrane protein [Gallionellaceae bacterium]
MQTEIVQLNDKELRNFAWVTGAAIIVFFGVLLPWIWQWTFPLWPWITAAMLGAWGTLLPATLRPVYNVWMRLANVLGWINTRIILSLVFFVVFFPFGLIMRILGKDPMTRRLDEHIDSYRVQSSTASRDKMEHPF